MSLGLPFIETIYNQFFSKLSKGEQEFFKSNERPEQELLNKYLPSEATVLEIGGGSGQTACIIDTILDPEYKSKHVVIEPSLLSFQKVKTIKEKIGGQFQIKFGFLAANREAQENLWPDCKQVQNFLYEDLGGPFDVISADCEGAFLHICKDFPELLQHAQLIFLENDGDTPNHRQLLLDNGFQCIHTQVHPYYHGILAHYPWNGRSKNIQELQNTVKNFLYFHEVWCKL